MMAHDVWGKDKKVRILSVRGGNDKFRIRKIFTDSGAISTFNEMVSKFQLIPSLKALLDSKKREEVWSVVQDTYTTAQIMQDFRKEAKADGFTHYSLVDGRLV